jgi:Putative Ig domain
MIPAIVSGLLAQRFAANEGLDDSNKYLLLGLVLGSKPIGLGITLALANQEAEHLPQVPAKPTPLRITTTSLPNATVGTPYIVRLTAEGGQLPYSWAEPTDNLPASLPLIPSTGKISGIPQPGDDDTFSITVEVTDAAGIAVDAKLQLIINPKTP